MDISMGISWICTNGYMALGSSGFKNLKWPSMETKEKQKYTPVNNEISKGEGGEPLLTGGGSYPR